MRSCLVMLRPTLRMIITGVPRGKRAFSMANHASPFRLVHKERYIWNKQIKMMATSAQQTFATQKISEKLFLLTEDQEKVQIDPDTLRLSINRKKPLVLIMPWVQGKHQQLKRLAEIYRGQGYDVLMTELNAYEMMFPVKGAQILAQNLLKFLIVNESFAPIVIHGFSAGAYLWAEVMVHMHKDIENPRYQSLLGRIRAQIWDSVVNTEEVPDSIPRALNLPEGIRYSVVKGLAQSYLKLFYNVATVHHFRTVDVYRATLVKAPALFIVSKADRVGTAETSWSVKADYEAAGIPVSWKCFEDSPHIGHFKKYPDEYTATMFSFLCSLNLFSEPVSLKSKI